MREKGGIGLTALYRVCVYTERYRVWGADRCAESNGGCPESKEGNDLFRIV